MAEMTRAERNDLMGVVKLRARVARTQVAQHEARLLAQVEEELSAVYSSREEAWRDVTVEAARHVEEADAKIAAICRDRGVREEFRPRLSLAWYGRGANADRERRGELRKLAQARIAAAAKEAKATIEAKSADVLTELVAGSLESEDARKFLETIPTPDQLMPPVTVAELEALAPPERRPEEW